MDGGEWNIGCWVYRTHEGLVRVGEYGIVFEVVAFLTKLFFCFVVCPRHNPICVRHNPIYWAFGAFHRCISSRVWEIDRIVAATKPCLHDLFMLWFLGT